LKRDKIYKNKVIFWILGISPRFQKENWTPKLTEPKRSLIRSWLITQFREIKKAFVESETLKIEIRLNLWTLIKTLR
jgi:hypothetical protein